MLLNVIMGLIIVVAISGFVYGLLINNDRESKKFKHDKISLFLTILLSCLILLLLLVAFGVFGEGYL